MIIAPHQDDETIGCGGTIALLRARGWRVGVVHVFCGNSGGPLKENAGLRRAEARGAGEVLGYDCLADLGFRDREDHDEARMIKALVTQIRAYQPSLLLAPHPAERDCEHRLVARAAGEASWTANALVFPGEPRHRVSVVMRYEVWSPIARPSLYVDISRVVDTKRAALLRFESQLASTSWVEGALGLNAHRACTLQGSGFVEAFELDACSLKTASKVFGDMSGESCGDQ